MVSSSSAVTDSDDFVTRSREFVDWFRNAPGTRLSAKIELADLRHRGAGRGVVATEDIAQDEELFAVPRSLVLMATTTTNTTSDYVPATPLPDHNSWLPLIIVTIQQLLRREQSKWHPYFRVLPATFDSLMFWSEEELAELQASAVRHRIGKEAADSDLRETIWPVIKADPGSFHLQGASDEERAEQAIRLGHYAGSLIMAYAFDVDRDDDSNLEEGKQSNGNGAADEDEDDLQSDDEDNPLKCLVPFADMLNADADRNNARLFQEEDGYLVMKAIKPIKAGEECLNDYGSLPRSELLRMYGYVTDNYKQYDVVEFSLDLIENVAGASRAESKAWRRKKAQLEEIGVLDDGYSFPQPEPSASLVDAIPGDLHMVLRGLCNNTPQPDGSSSRGSLTVDEAALLSAVATKKLSEYATSLQADTNSLLTDAPPPTGSVSAKRYQMAIQVRIGEKEILLQVINLCKDFIAARTNEQKRKLVSGHSSPPSKKKKSRAS
ncbi:hypothetical protein DV735_g654, partial [Chaetothyriales sp. CBS 134920]